MAQANGRTTEEVRRSQQRPSPKGTLTNAGLSLARQPIHTVSLLEQVTPNATYGLPLPSFAQSDTGLPKGRYKHPCLHISLGLPFAFPFATSSDAPIPLAPLLDLCESGDDRREWDREEGERRENLMKANAIDCFEREIGAKRVGYCRRSEGIRGEERC